MGMLKRFNVTIFKFISHPGLGKTIFLWFLILSLAPLLIASIISYLTASNILRHDAVQSLNTVSRLKTEYINSFFNERINDLKLLSNLSANAHSVKELKNDLLLSNQPLADYVHTYEWSVSTIQITLDLRHFFITYNYDDIFVLDLEGNILVAVNDDTLPGQNVFTGELKDTKFAQTCRKALETEEPLFSDLEYFGLDADDREVAGFLVQIMKDPEAQERFGKKEKVGIMALRIPMRQINQIMKADMGAGKTLETYLIGSDLRMRSESRTPGTEIKENESANSTTTPIDTTSTSPGTTPPTTPVSSILAEKLDPTEVEGVKRWENYLKDLTKTQKEAKDGKKPPTSFSENYKGYNYRHEMVQGVCYNLESLDSLGVHWGLIAEISEAEAFNSARSLLFIVAFIVLGTVTIVSFFSIIVAKRIVEPIRKLSGWAKQVAIGDLSYEEITLEKNEIGEMNSSFKNVVDSFQALTDVCQTIAIGDFTKTVNIKSDKDSLGKAVNQMRDNLVEVVRQADNISMGDYSGEVVPRSEYDMLGIALERMTRTLRDAAKVAEEVSIGDYSLKMMIKGEKDMLGKALNQMIARLQESNIDTQRKIDYLNNIPTPVHVIDRNYNVQFINHAGAEVVGLTIEECIGKKCYSLFHATHCQTDKCRSFRAMNFNKVLTGDMVAYLPKKEIPMRYTSAPIKDSQENIIGAIEYMLDINDEIQVVALAEKISRGDYSVNIEKRSDEDRLSDALNRMTLSLRDAVEQNKRQNWLKTGQTELNNRMRGELNIKELSQNIICFLTSYLDAQVGLLYFVARPDVLKLVGSYALGKEKRLAKAIKFGEGLAGQTALENLPIHITNIPRENIKIRMGFGDIIPQDVIVLPFSYEGNVIGVIEIASLHQFTEIHIEFLNQSLENIAIALNSAESRRQLKDLLKKTQEQAEKLQSQQEELRQSNEELEGQTRALIASETNLQSQQEELRVINEELEERTKALEKQKSDIQEKNRELLSARKELEKKARDLEEVSKYKSQFLANMSHELRTPLNSILILSQLLSNNKDANLSAKQVEFSRTIHSSGSDLLVLINEILDLSKIEAGMMEIRIESISIEGFINDLRRVFKPVAANKGLEFITEITGDHLPSTFDTDGQRSQQVVKNLLSNAFKFTDEGSVTLRACQPAPEINLSRSGLKHNETIAFSVIDTGIGIPEDKREVIFEAFRQEDGTTSRKYGGTGLGLSISRELAELLGGEIQMDSVRGKGSTFTLYLPLKLTPIDSQKKRSPLPTTEDEEPEVETVPTRDTPSEPPISREEEKEAPPPPPSTTKISTKEIDRGEIRDDRRVIKPGDKTLLIIEDDSRFSEVLLELARAKGFKCIVAEDGETGLHFADFYKPGAIILDVGLPGIDGWQVMDRLKTSPETRHIPVHFMSASDKPADAMKMGAIGYLSKPVNSEALEDAFSKIEKMIAKPVKKLLVVETDEIQKQKIIDLMGSGDVATVTVKNGTEAFNALRHEDFDCLVMDPDIPDIPGFELLDKIYNEKDISLLPIIIYSARELTDIEKEKLEQYAKMATIKDVRSPERLLAETTLFLHRVASDLPEAKQQMISRMIDKESLLKGRKILIVDDDMRNVFALTSILEEKGMVTIVGKNGKEGIERLESIHDIDLVLMDIMMPIMDGYEAMRLIRKDKRFEKLPIIALTAKAMKGDRHKCVAAGANDYLAKPVEPAKLLSLLRVWLYNK